MLHASLALRLTGDATGDLTAWRWGGALNETAIVMFVASAVATAVRARRAG